MRPIAFAAALILASSCSFAGEPVSLRDAATDVPAIDAPLPACAQDDRYDRSAGVPLVLRVEIEANETWDMAKATCDGEGAMLAVLTDQAARDHANAVAPGGRTWIGFRASEPLVWRWEDGTVVDVVRGADGWGGNKPNDDNQDCARIDQNGEFDDEPCTDSEDFLCQCPL